MAFSDHLELLRFFLGQRAVIIERIERLLNAQKQPLEYQQQQGLIAQQFKDCFFLVPGIAPELQRLRDQLEFAHWQAGFKPRETAGNDIIDPAALVVRAFHMWRHTRWPGQKGRLRYANTLFNVYLLRCLTLLTMRLWDEEHEGVADRLSAARRILDALWFGSPADQPLLVRNLSWLIPIAISPTTDHLSGYFTVAQSIAETFTEADHLETQKAWVQTAGGHLRSQLHHLSVQRGVTIDDRELVLLTRRSNTLDIALLVQGLVPLLRAYQRAISEGSDEQRRILAQAICEGISPDPKLFVNDIALLCPYSMIDYLFITTGNAGHARYTAAGQRHLQLLAEYRQLMTTLANSLLDDCRYSRENATLYSPYGLLYGFSSNLLELMALKMLQLDVITRFSLEDAFITGGDDKRAWVNQWRDLPHVSREVVKQFEYPQQFAADIHARVEQALQRFVSDQKSTALGRMYLPMEPHLQMDDRLAKIPELPVNHVLSSDLDIVALGEATAMDEADLLSCRLEGEFLVSYRSAAGWVGISKDVLTDLLAHGHDVMLPELPLQAAATLQAMCPGLVVTQPAR